MNLTSFQYVVAMNQAFGNMAIPALHYYDGRAPGDPLPPRAEYTAAWTRLEKQCKNILAEYNELQLALVARSVEDVRDALCDIQVFAMGAQHFLSVDGDADMDAVLDGVMTRFCKDPAELTATVLHWAKRGVTEVRAEGEFPRVCIKATADQTDCDGDIIPTGKFLKSVGYKNTVFPQHVKEAPDTVADSVPAAAMPVKSGPLDAVAFESLGTATSRRYFGMPVTEENAKALHAEAFANIAGTVTGRVSSHPEGANRV